MLRFLGQGVKLGIRLETRRVLAVLGRFSTIPTPPPPSNTNVKSSSASPPDVIEDDDNLQGHWRSLESRVVKRKTKKEGPRGRRGLKQTAWDHEHV